MINFVHFCFEWSSVFGLSPMTSKRSFVILTRCECFISNSWTFESYSPYIVCLQKAISFLGGIDTIIINHAIFDGMIARWQGTDEQLDMFDKLMAVNFNSFVYIASHALPHLKLSRVGRLGIVSSLLGMHNLIFLHYSAFTHTTVISILGARYISNLLYEIFIIISETSAKNLSLDSKHLILRCIL